MPTVTSIVVFNATVSIKGIRLTEIPLTAYLEYYIDKYSKISVDFTIFSYRFPRRRDRNPGKPILPTIRAVTLKSY